MVTEDSNKVKTLRDLVEAQRVYVAYLEQLRAELVADRMAKCSPPDSAEMIFDDMAVDLRLMQERRRLGEREQELANARKSSRSVRVNKDLEAS